VWVGMRRSENVGALRYLLGHSLPWSGKRRSGWMERNRHALSLVRARRTSHPFILMSCIASLYSLPLSDL
jgi:hypothetical protein